MNNTNLLVADSNLSYLEMARKMLRFHSSAYSIDVVTSSEECLEKLLENHYHLLLLSCNLDGNKGLDVLSQIVKTGLDIPVVFLLEEGKEHLIYEAIERGAFDYIIKVSGHLNSLPHVVNKILDKRKKEAPQIEQNEQTEHVERIEQNEQKAQIDQFEIKDPQFILTDSDSNGNKKGHYFLNRRGKFTSINPRMEEKLHFSETELLELTLEDLIHPDDIHNYYKWLAGRDTDLDPQNFKTSLLGKQGNTESVEISIEPIRDRNNEVVSYKGDIDFKLGVTNSQLPTKGNFDQSNMIQDIRKLLHFSYDNSLNHFLEKITQHACRQFQFKRGTLALLDRRKKMFIKQILVGYSNGNNNGYKVVEIPQEVIDTVFANQFKVRVLYHDQELTKSRSALPAFEDRRLQKRDSKDKWHPNNVIVLNLADKHNKTFGYISIDTPVNSIVPSREIFHNLELFSTMVSMAIENYYNFSILEKRNRRLKRLLVTGNIFKLNISGSEIMKESVWSIKFSMDYNLVMLGLINSSSDVLEIAAVACDDRVRSIQFKEMSIPSKDIRSLIKKEYRVGRSYLIENPEPALSQLKDIYYDAKNESSDGKSWNWWHTLIIPIFEKDNKIIGFLIVDDPIDGMLPSKEVVQTLEIFATQISIAIENRATYLNLKNKFEQQKNEPLDFDKQETEGGIKRLAEIFFK